MPIRLATGAPTLIVRRDAFERSGLARHDIDRTLTLTDEEFRVEKDLVVIGPVYDEAGLTELMRAFEDAGLEHFDDFFEMSGNWPEWMTLHAMSQSA